MYTLENATMDELATCYEIVDDGRKFQREQGFTQWTEDYPNEATIRNDIETGKGYVLKSDGKIAGYMCVDFDGEPAYENIQGAWMTVEPYAVVHRMSFSRDFRGKGIADIAFGLVDELCVSRGVNAIRADTDFPNKRMQHVLTKNGFAERGVIIFQGSDKIAYDKVINV